MLLHTPHGNVLWDLISLLNPPTTKFVCISKVWLPCRDVLLTTAQDQYYWRLTGHRHISSALLHHIRRMGRVLQLPRVYVQ